MKKVENFLEAYSLLARINGMSMASLEMNPVCQIYKVMVCPTKPDKLLKNSHNFMMTLPKDSMLEIDWMFSKSTKDTPL